MKSLKLIILFFVLDLSLSLDNCIYKHKSKSSLEKFNKGIVRKFFRAYKNPSKIESIAQRFISKNYIQHNPNIPDGREAIIQAVQKLFKNSTTGPVEFIRNIAADGDLVWVHEKVRLPNEKEYAVVDIFRLECGQFAEHWDVLQEIDSNPAKKYPNTHPYF